MQWLVFIFALEAGFVPTNNWVMHETDYYMQEQNQYYVEFAIEAELFEYAFVGGTVKTRMYDGAKYFSPFTDEYMFNAGLRFDMLELGFRHFCTHPVIPYIQSNGADINYEGGYEEIYFRIEVKSNGK